MRMSLFHRFPLSVNLTGTVCGLLLLIKEENKKKGLGFFFSCYLDQTRSLRKSVTMLPRSCCFEFLNKSVCQFRETHRQGCPFYFLGVENHACLGTPKSVAFYAAVAACKCRFFKNKQYSCQEKFLVWDTALQWQGSPVASIYSVPASCLWESFKGRVSSKWNQTTAGLQTTKLLSRPGNATFVNCRHLYDLGILGSISNWQFG